MPQCYTEFICDSSTIILKVKPGCTCILAKLISDKMNDINSNNVHLIFVKFIKGDGLLEQVLNKLNVFFYFQSNVSFAITPLSCHDRASFIQNQPVQIHEYRLKDDMWVFFIKMLEKRIDYRRLHTNKGSKT